jgi:hypothetical protein
MYLLIPPAAGLVFSIGLTPFEYLNVLISDAKSPHKREPLNLI